MEKLPLVDIDGQLTELPPGFDLPNQSDIDENRQLIAKLVLCLIEQGIDITDEDLLNLLNEL